MSETFKRGWFANQRHGKVMVDREGKITLVDAGLYGLALNQVARGD